MPVLFAASWDGERRSMQLVNHGMARFLTTLTGVMLPALGQREPCRAAVMIIAVLVTVNKKRYIPRQEVEEQEAFAVEVRSLVTIII